MSGIRARAHGKVNLTLDIVGKRSDGYHELVSVMQSISWHDVLYIEPGRPGEIALQVEGDDQVPSSADNIVWQAARAFFQSSRIRGGAVIRLQKNIPSAAGLGGGSADAAATLLALNALFQADLPHEVLADLALTLGADVPFCLTGGTQLAEGVGERLTLVPALPALPILLIKPPEGVSTPQVFRSLQPQAWGTTYSQRFVEHLKAGNVFEALTMCGNALETVTLTLVPAAEQWKKYLAGESSLVSLMSGSGPTVFGVFPDDMTMRKTAQGLPSGTTFHHGHLHHCGVELTPWETGGC